MRQTRATGRPGLSVVVPAWNEAERIEACLQELHGSLAHLRPEVVVVDDGSSDGTADLASAWIARHPECDAHVLSIPHGGKGRAVHAGVRRTRGDDVAYIDADLDIPATEIERLLHFRDAVGADVVVGSKRSLTWHELPRPLFRRVISVSFSWLVARLFHLPVRDTQTGVKLFSGRWLRAAVPHAQVSGYLFDVELLASAAADGLNVAEVPVAVTMRRRASRIGLGDCLCCLVELGAVVRSVGRGRTRHHLRRVRATHLPRHLERHGPAVGHGAR